MADRSQAGRSPDGRPPSRRALLGEALRAGGDLIGKELKLFQVEADGNIRALAALIARFGFAAILLVGGLLLLVLAFVRALGALIGSQALAALAVGGGFAAITAIFLVLGVRRMSLNTLNPRRSERQLARDARLVGAAGE
jgi:hypothetical protein